MDERLRLLCKELCAKSSKEAADWLIEKYPISSKNYGEQFILLSHRSWRKTDQIRLAEYYLQKIPFASGKGYDAFIKIMSIKLFVKIIEMYLPTEESDLHLLLYYLEPALNKLTLSDSEHEVVNRLIEKVIWYRFNDHQVS